MKFRIQKNKKSSRSLRLTSHSQFHFIIFYLLSKLNCSQAAGYFLSSENFKNFLSPKNLYVTQDFQCLQMGTTKNHCKQWGIKPIWSNKNFEMREIKTRKKNERGIYLFFALAFIFLVPLINAAADFAVNSFSCTPSEAAINDVFSCTAQIKNNGDAAGSVSTATLYSDANDWLEESNYAQSSGTSVDPGQTTEVTFTSLRAIKSGNNGFSKIMLDDVTDTYVADNNIKENIINVVIAVSSSDSSAGNNTQFDATAEVTAGGNIDVELTFTVNSGGCSIGSQTNPKTITDMSDGNIQSRSWSVTMGTSGDCQYTITASATGDANVASKQDSDSGLVTCTDCSSGSGDSGSSGSSGSGGGSSSSASGSNKGGGSGIGTTVAVVDELPATYITTLKENENLQFIFSNETHFLSVTEVTDTSATIVIESKKQTFVLSIGEKINADLDGDEFAEISIKLDSINSITRKASITIKRLTEKVAADKVVDESETKEKKETEKNNYIPWIAGAGVVVAILLIYLIYFLMRQRTLHRPYFSAR